jgi:cobalt-zinc-cadmium efflux system outer membrane protein
MLALGAFGVAASGAEGAGKEAPASSPTLQALIAEALDRSAELAAMREQIAAAQARVITAAGLPDPMASAGLSNIMVGGISLDRDPMSGVEFMLSQDVTRSVRRRLRGEIQEGEVLALEARYAAIANGIVRGVKQGYIDLQYLDEAVAISEQNRDIAADVLAISEVQYATGKVGQQDVFQSQVQLSRLLDSLVLLRRERAAAATRLNRLLYRPPGQLIPKLPGLAHTTPSGEAISAALLKEKNSVLRESLARIQQAASQVRLAEQWRKPDYTLTFGYMIRQQIDADPMTGTDMWSASVGINLPWLNRRVHEQELRAAQAEHRGSQQSLQVALNAIPSRIEELTIEIQRSDEQLSLVETGLLPQAEGALAASRAAYVTGKTTLLNVLSNQLNLYNLQLERVQLLREHEQNLAELEYETSGALQPQAMAPVSAPALSPTPGATPSMGGDMPPQTDPQVAGQPSMTPMSGE